MCIKAEEGMTYVDQMLGSAAYFLRHDQEKEDEEETRQAAREERLAQ